MKCPYCGFNHLEPQARCMRCRKPIDNIIGEQSDSSVNIELMRSVILEKSIPEPEINEEESDPMVAPENVEPEILAEPEDELLDEGPEDGSLDDLYVGPELTSHDSDQSGIEFTQNHTVDVKPISDYDETIPAPENDDKIIEGLSPEDEKSNVDEDEIYDDETDVDSEEPGMTVLPIELVSGSMSDVTVVAVDSDDETKAEHLVIENESEQEQVVESLENKETSIEDEIIDDETDDLTEPLSMKEDDVEEIGQEDELSEEITVAPDVLDEGTEETTALLEKMDKLVDEMTGFEDIDVIKEEKDEDHENSDKTSKEEEAVIASLCEVDTSLIEEKTSDELQLQEITSSMIEDEMSAPEPEDFADASVENIEKPHPEPVEALPNEIEEKGHGTGLYEEFKEAKPEQLPLNVIDDVEKSASLSCEKPVLESATDKSLADVYQTSGTWNESRLDNFFDEKSGKNAPFSDEVSLIEICPGKNEPKEEKILSTEKMKPAKLPFDTSISCETIEEQVADKDCENKDRTKNKIKISKMTLKNAVAGMLDMAVWTAMGIILFELSTFFVGANNLHGTAGDWVSLVILPVMIMTSILALLYGGLFGTIIGRTPGMMACGLHMVGKDGKRPDINSAFIRAGLVIGATVTMGISMLPSLRSKSDKTFISKISGVSVESI